MPINLLQNVGKLFLSDPEDNLLRGNFHQHKDEILSALHFANMYP